MRAHVHIHTILKNKKKDFFNFKKKEWAFKADSWQSILVDNEQNKLELKVPAWATKERATLIYWFPVKLCHSRQSEVQVCSFLTVTKEALNHDS